MAGLTGRLKNIMKAEYGACLVIGIYLSPAGETFGTATFVLGDCSCPLLDGTAAAVSALTAYPATTAVG